MCEKVCLCLTGVSLSLHGSEPQRRRLHRRRVPLQPSASGYQAADRPLTFSSCGKAEIMEESSAEVPDSSTQDDVPPLGETLQHRICVANIKNCHSKLKWFCSTTIKQLKRHIFFPRGRLRPKQS